MSDLYNCSVCHSPTRMQVQATISAPGELSHQFSKSNLRRGDVYLMGVNWETADYICTNPDCQHVTNGYGNYVSRLEAKVEALEGDVASWKRLESEAAEVRDMACGQVQTLEGAAQLYLDAQTDCWAANDMPEIAKANARREEAHDALEALLTGAEIDPVLVKMGIISKPGETK